MLLGFGTQAAATVAVFHILNHAIFKAALFMTAGIVDHEAHSRDLRRLGGLRTLMPVTFAIALLGALAMAGIPPLNGFLSKELMLQEAAQTVWLTPWAMGLLATAAALLSVAYSLRFVANGFLGPVRSDYPHLPHDPGPGLWAAPAILAVLAVVIGLVPMTSAAWLVGTAAQAVTGEPVAVKITHWHGLQAAALWMSLAAVGGGLMVLGAWPRLRALWDAMPKPEARRMFDALVEPLAAIARSFTERLHDGDFGRAIAIAVVTIAGAGLWAFAGGNHSPGHPRAPAGRAGRRRALGGAARGGPRHHRASPRPGRGTDPDQPRRTDHRPLLRLPFGAGPCPDPDLGRGGDRPAHPAGPALPARDHAGRAAGPAPPVVGRRRGDRRGGRGVARLGDDDAASRLPADLGVPPRPVQARRGRHERGQHDHRRFPWL